MKLRIGSWCLVLDRFACPEFFMALCSFAVATAMVGNGCMQHFGQGSDTWGTGLLQVFLGTSVLAQAVLKILETLFHP